MQITLNDFQVGVLKDAQKLLGQSFDSLLNNILEDVAVSIAATQRTLEDKEEEHEAQSRFPVKRHIAAFKLEQNAHIKFVKSLSTDDAYKIGTGKIGLFVQRSGGQLFLKKARRLDAEETQRISRLEPSRISGADRMTKEEVHQALINFATFDSDFEWVDFDQKEW